MDQKRLPEAVRGLDENPRARSGLIYDLLAVHKGYYQYYDPMTELEDKTLLLKIPPSVPRQGETALGLGWDMHFSQLI